MDRDAYRSFAEGSRYAAESVPDVRGDWAAWIGAANGFNRSRDAAIILGPNGPEVPERHAVTGLELANRGDKRRRRRGRRAGSPAVPDSIRRSVESAAQSRIGNCSMASSSSSSGASCGIASELNPASAQREHRRAAVANETREDLDYRRQGSRFRSHSTGTIGSIFSLHHRRVLRADGRRHRPRLHWPDFQIVDKDVDLAWSGVADSGQADRCRRPIHPGSPFNSSRRACF